MERSRIAAVSALLLALAAGPLSADEIKGKVKDVAADKNEITVNVDNADRVYAVSGDAKVVGLVGKKIKKATIQDLAGGLRGVKQGAEVTLTTQTKDGKDEVVQVKVDGLQAKKKKKAK